MPVAVAVVIAESAVLWGGGDEAALFRAEAGPSAPMPLVLADRILPGHPVVWAPGEESRRGYALLSRLIAESGVAERMGEGDRVALVLATTGADLGAGEDAMLAHFEGRAPALPLDFLGAGLAGGLADAVAAELRISGPVLAVSTACTSGAVALGVGASLLDAEIVDEVLVLGVDALCRTTFFGFRCLGAMSRSTCRPFAPDRDGMMIGEAAALVRLTRAEVTTGQVVLHAVATATDGFHLTAPHPEGAGLEAAIRAALGALPLESVDHVNAHGTATEANDPVEAKVLARLFPDAAVSATKGRTGHTLGAAGLLEAVLLARGMREGRVPGGGSAAALAGLRLGVDRADQRVGVSVNLAFGGHNSAVVLTCDGEVAAPASPRIARSPEALVGPRSGDRHRAAVLGARSWSHAGGQTLGALPILPGGRSFLGAAELVRPAAVEAGAWRRMSRLGRLAVVVAAPLLEGMDPAERGERLAVVWGTGIGEFSTSAAFMRTVHERGPAGASPLLFQTSVHSAAAGQLSIAFGLHGPSETICAGMATPTMALLRALLLVEERGAPVLLVLADELGPDVRTGLTYAEGTEPFGEGAAAILLAPALDGPASVVLTLLRGPAAKGAWHRVGRWPFDPPGGEESGDLGRAVDRRVGLFPTVDGLALADVAAAALAKGGAGDAVALAQGWWARVSATTNDVPDGAA